MKSYLKIVAFVSIAASLKADTNTPSRLTFNAGGDFRIRQEIMHNVVGLPGASGAVLPQARKENINHIRMRVRPWVRADYESLNGEKFGLYVRAVDEVREYVVKNGARRDDRSYNFPDEVALDNLYFYAKGLYDGFLDFQIGRQDLFNGRESFVGLNRQLLDGAPYVGSRSAYADMAWVTLHFADDSKLDIFGLFDNGRNQMSWGTRESRDRSMNALHPGDSYERDEWGGGIVYSSALFEKRIPYKLYAIHKHVESYTAGRTGVRMPDKQITSLGVLMEPQITEEISLELESAKQVGSTAAGSRQAGGFMEFAGIDYHPHVSKVYHPFAKLSFYYLSGDKHRTEADDNDTAWDPMWARAPCDSELFQYGTLYGLGYWSNIIYVKPTVGVGFGPHHKVSAYSGPLWAAVDDELGRTAEHADKSSAFKGWLSAARYDFPILLAPKNAHGLERFEIFGHVMAELFNPGDYYESSKPAYFIRWELIFRF